MMSEPSHSRITVHVADEHEDWSDHGLVAVQLTFPVPKIRIEDAGSLGKVIEPVIEQAEAAGYRWNPPHVYVMSLQYGAAAYTSVHRSYQGARRRLTDCCADWGILDLLANSEMGQDGTADTRGATGEEDDQLVYGIGYLEIEE
jgi:hypothetical protein